MLLVPLISGTVADHESVPEAVPLPPVELLQMTDVALVDVPLIWMLLADVEMMVNPGDVI